MSMHLAVIELFCLMHAHGQTDKECQRRSAWMRKPLEANQRIGKRREEARRKEWVEEKVAARCWVSSACLIARTLNWVGRRCDATWPCETLGCCDLGPCRVRVWKCSLQAHATHTSVNSVLFLPSHPSLHCLETIQRDVLTISVHSYDFYKLRLHWYNAGLSARAV
jgi:hypothetical protein